MNPLATLIADDLYLVVTPLEGDDEPTKAAVEIEGRTSPVEARFMRLTDELVVVTVRLDEPHGRFSIRSKTRSYDLGEIGLLLTSTSELVQTYLASLAPAVRSRLCAFLARTPAEHAGQREWPSLSRGIAALHGRLRHSLRTCVIAPDNPHGLAAEVVMAVDARSFYVRGWLHSREAQVTRLTVVSPEGSRVEILDRAYRFPRSDIADLYGDPVQDELSTRSGFAAWFELDAPSLLDAGWILELEDGAGQAVEATVHEVVREPLVVRNRMLSELILEPPYEQTLLSRHVHPAIDRLQTRHREEVGLAGVREYGTAIEAPEVSVIVPLYGRTDFMQHQLAQFAHDPEMQAVDLIYALDSPELARDLDYVALQLFELYRIPFRIAVLRRNSGYSAANNVGVSIARGRLLLLLNSDVLPDRPGWLGTMSAFYDADPKIGTLGAKLIYEDDTIQHGGMFFAPEPRTRLWCNEHLFKGMHRSLPAANFARPVAAVTAACLMIDRALYLRIGGLHGGYVQGDYEDSDLCLRVSEEGFENWYLPTAELYHLEGQSYAAPLRELTWRYNAWLHTQLWNERIEQIGEELSHPTTESAPSVRKRPARRLRAEVVAD
jgi:GT2 family glycosyltransferase